VTGTNLRGGGKFLSIGEPDFNLGQAGRYSFKEKGYSLDEADVV
jgi:hypothetical protein